jgi:hypothetical protein
MVAVTIERNQRERVTNGVAHFLGDQCFEIGIAQFNFAIGQFLESGEHLVERIAMQVITHLLQGVGKRMTAGMLAQNDFRLALTNCGWIHDFVGRALIQHAVLMDTRFMCKRITTNNGLVVLNGIGSEATHQTRSASQFLGLDTGIDATEVIGTSTERHHDFFQRSVTGTLTQTVDCTFDLTCTQLHCSQRVGNGHTQIVMAVGGDDVVALDHLAHVGQTLGVFLRNSKANGVGDVQGGRTIVDSDLQNFAHEVEIGTRRVFWRELDIVGVRTSASHTRCCFGLYLVGSHAQLVLHVRFAGGDEHVNAATLCRLNRFPTTIDIAQGRTRQTTDDWSAYRLRNGLH